MRKILTGMVAVCFVATIAQPLCAQGTPNTLRSGARRGSLAGLAPSAADQIPSGQYPTQSLEDLRTELLNLTDSIQEFADIAPPDAVDVESLRTARTQIQQMSLQNLNALRQGIDPSKIHSRLIKARAGVAEYSQARSAGKITAIARPKVDVISFPNASGFCSTSTDSDVSRIPTSVVLAADVVFFIADGVRELAQDACKQDVLGENTSLACAIVDTVWIVAKGVDEGIHFCDENTTGSVVDANYSRLNDVHGDVNAVDAHVTNVDNHVTSEFTSLDTHVANEFTALDTHVAIEFTALDTHVGNVDAHIAAEFVTLDTHLTLLIANLSAQLTAATSQIVDLEKQIMKLDLTPEGQRQIVPAILTCDGAPSGPTACPNVLTLCQSGKCFWNNVGPLP